MKPNLTQKQYAFLTPRERFRLILAAGSRGDEAEQQRLRQSGHRLEMKVPDHAPHAQAFADVAQVVFLDLANDAAHYDEYLLRADAAYESHLSINLDEEGEELSPATNLSERYLDLALSTGTIIKGKAGGWKLFCERLSVPPFALWEHNPGYERVVEAVKAVETVAFTSEGFIRWMNRIRPEGTPEMVSFDNSAETMAAEIEKAFEARVQWWCG